MGTGAERLDPRIIQQQLAEFRLGEPTSEGRRPLHLIVAATSSARRESLIRTVANGLPVISLPLGEEELDSTKTGRVVRDKLQRARMVVSEARETGVIPPGLRVAIIAADTQSGPVALNRHGEPILKHQSKPRSEADVMRVLRQMRKAAESGKDPFYEVISTSGITYDPSNEKKDLIPSPMKTTIYLTREGLTYLTTASGFERYHSEFNELHQSETYTNGGELKIVTLRSTAAGLSVSVLTKMGMVEGINDKKVGDPGFEDEFKSAVSIAGAGISPEVLSAVNANAVEIMRSWSFPQRMADYALRHRAA